jgi:ribonucleoside-diphosphate reductase alpha chain
MNTVFSNSFSESQWKSKYRFGDEKTVDDTFRRVANAVASVEKEDKEKWANKFYAALQNFKFVPGGRILSNAGTGLKGTTLLNCYVDGFTGTDKDSIEGIYNAVFRQAKTLQSEGGYGFCADVMRPRGANIAGIANQSPGAIKFLELWDKSSEIITAGSGDKSKKGEKSFIRKGAQMVTMSVWHPDIIEFITAKQTKGRLSKFNMSVLVSDEFMRAVEEDADWNLEYPNYKKWGNEYKAFWDGNLEHWKEAKGIYDLSWKDGLQHEWKETCTQVYKTIKARELWSLITESTYNRNEPGVLFVDTMNRMNNLWYKEWINATNPCGEQILPKHGVCLLGSINLAQYIDFVNGTFDWAALERDIKIFVRFLDNVNDITNVPLPEQQETVKNKRRIGLGIFGYASALMMLKIPYGSKQALELTEKLMAFVYNNAYRASSNLAVEKGVFPEYDAEQYLKGEYIKGLWKETQEIIAHQGMRNSHIGSIQPTGNSSVFANLISSGCEPIFDKGYVRTFIVDHVPEGLDMPTAIDWVGKTFTSQQNWKWTKEGDEEILLKEFNGSVYKVDRNRGLTKEEWVEDYGISQLKEKGLWEENADWTTVAMNLNVDAHIDTLSVFAKYIDSAISKTLNIQADYPYEDFKDVYTKAWKNGIKGVTTYREGTMTAVLSSKSTKVSGIQKTNAPKRPKELECDVHHIKVKGQDYFVLVGLYEGEPYEVFAGINGVVDKKVKKGRIIKRGRSKYKAEFDDDSELSPIGAFTGGEEDTITRLVSAGLRHGASVDFIVHQLEKSKGDMQSFAKSIVRALKKYISDGSEVKGEECPECKGRLLRQDGCKTCKDCGYSACT